MRVLLDECLPKRLGRQLTGHHVNTVPELGWASIKNGRLLSLAQEQFDVFLTTDQNLPFQQNLGQFNISVVIVCAQSHRLKDLVPLVPELLRMLPTVKKGEATTVRK